MTFDKTNIKGLILDMDGVIWRDSEPIGDLPKTFSKIRDLGLKFVLATNNSTRSIDEYVAKMKELGVEVYPNEILNSSQATAKVLASKFPTGSEIYYIGETGLSTALIEEGFVPTSAHNFKNPKAVVMGIDRTINFEKVARAALLINTGLPFYATNPDQTFPTPLGLIPGNGAWTSVLITATGVQPIITGKPDPAMLHVSMQRMGTGLHETIMVGDRLETDILGAQNAGCHSCLVLSGVTTQHQAQNWDTPIDIITDDLSSLVFNL